MYFVLIYHRVNSKTGLFSSHSRSLPVRARKMPVPFRLRFESVPVP